MRTRAHKNCIGATTFVEVVVAIAVVAIAGGGVLSALGYGFNAISTVRENQRATQILVEKTETIRLYNWDQVNSNGFIPSTFTAVYDPKASSGQQGVTYNGTVSISSFSSGTSYQTNMRVLTVGLTWPSGERTLSRSLLTTIARDGVQNYVW
jgi:type II secretory pathway pseudopilin PulG